MNNTRLGIPVIFHEECLHGHAAIDSTSFCQPIGLAATFNPELVEALFTMTAYEARVRGTHQALTPVVDVARDPRWGRVEETYGEDPYLVTHMGIAAVRGFQGDRKFRDKKRVIATLKHFAAHGQPESGMNCAPVNVSLRVLRETFLSTFKGCIHEAGAISVMASYNEIDGVPSHANRWLLRDVLRKEWGFKGFVVSDYYSIWELHHRPDTHGHFVAADKREACALAVKAGVNIELPEPDCYLHLVELVKKEVLKESQLDELVAPMLYWKFKLGLFDDPYVDPDEAERVVGCDEHRKLALQAARETITLLKNDGDLAPLKLDALKSIAVIGPNAGRCLHGGYSGVPKHNVSVLDGIKAKVGDRIEVLYSEGCEITKPGHWNQDEVLASDPDEDRRKIAEAIEVAKQADVIVLCIGGNEMTSREAWNLKHMGDRTSLDLIGRQAGTGRGNAGDRQTGHRGSVQRPAAFDQSTCRKSSRHFRMLVSRAKKPAMPWPKFYLAIITPAANCRLPSRARPAICRRFTTTSRRPDVAICSTTFRRCIAFGFGLSYTTFSFGHAAAGKEKNSPQRRTPACWSMSRTQAAVRGDEVVQMYIRDLVSSVTRPVKELKGFQRITLEPGETKTVALDITPELLAFYDIDMKFVVEPGEFEIMVGNSSRDADLQKIVLTVDR